jgi:hypothetical protein
MDIWLQEDEKTSKTVDGGCKEPIEIRFETLTLKNKEKPYTWYKKMKYDKGFASKVRRGLLIPKKEDRIKIASYFQTDSGNIWMPEEIVKFELEEEKKKLEAKNGE